MCVSSKPRGSEMILFAGTPDMFFTSVCWQKQRVARISDSNRRGNSCENAFRYQEFKILATQGGNERNQKSFKAHARVLMRQARVPTERHQSVHNLEVLADEFQNNFLVKKV